MMPADHGPRPDDFQSVQHARCQVDAAEGQSLRRFTSQHVELMTKRQDLCLQRRSRPEQSDQRTPNQAANIPHQPRASPNSTSLASRIEFPTMTGIDNAEKDGSRRKPCGIGRQQIRRCLRIADRRIGEEVDSGYARRHLVQHRLHLTRIRAVQPKIREQHNHVVSLLKWARALQRSQVSNGSRWDPLTESHDATEPNVLWCGAMAP